MRVSLALAASAALLAALSPAIAKRLSPEDQLAKLIEGRVAGKPVHCISNLGVRNMIIVDKTAIVYDAGTTVYVNQPRMGAEYLDDAFSVLVTYPTGSQLCSLDRVDVYERGSSIQRGFIGLGEFVPYRKVPAREG